MQPTHCTSDMPWAEKRVGPERIKGAYAWRRLLNLKTTIVFGSDAPVESIDPRLGIYAAVTRKDLAGMPRGGWYPDQRLTVDETLRGFSFNATSVVGADPERGDFVVFDRDLRKISVGKIPKARVLKVFVGGVQRYPPRG